MQNKSILFALAVCMGMQCGVSFGMVYRPKRAVMPQRTMEPQVDRQSIWYVGGDQSGVIAKSEAVRLVKEYITQQLEDSLEYPMPLTKIRELLKKINILPWGVEYNDEIFTEACDQLIQEIQAARKNIATKKELKKDKLIDDAIARFNNQLSTSQDKYNEALNLLGVDGRALSSIVLSMECQNCNEEVHGKEKYATMKVQAKRRAPMNATQIKSFEARKKELAEKLQNVWQKKQQMQTTQFSSE
jgi:hypothetical protein